MPNRRIPFELMLLDDHPELLNGLDSWLKLGLISDNEVKRWAKRYLVSAMPEVDTMAPLAKVINSPNLASIANLLSCTTRMRSFPKFLHDGCISFLGSGFRKVYETTLVALHSRDLSHAKSTHSIRVNAPG